MARWKLIAIVTSVVVSSTAAASFGVYQVKQVQQKRQQVAQIEQNVISQTDTADLPQSNDVSSLDTTKKSTKTKTQSSSNSASQDETAVEQSTSPSSETPQPSSNQTSLPSSSQSTASATPASSSSSSDHSTPSSGSSSTKGTTSPVFGGDVPCTSNANPSLTYDITDLSKIRSIVPPGEASSNEIKPHSFLNIDTSKTTSVAVYAPYDLDLIDGAHVDQGSGKSDYSLAFQLSCEVWLRFHHITNPVDKIKNALPSTPQSSSAGIKITPIMSFKAGEQVGTTSGTTQANNWDFGFYSTKQTNQFVNLDRYRQFNTYGTYVNSVCGYDYFSSSKKTAYYAKFGGFGDPIVDSKCRSAMQDVSGSLKGAWFGGPTSQGPTTSTRFAVNLDMDGATIKIVGIGSSMTIYSNYSTYKKPQEVTGEHCYYDSVSRYLYFKLISSSEVQAADGTGSCPGTFPSSGYSTYYR